MPLIFPTSDSKIEIVTPSDFKLSIGAMVDNGGSDLDLSKMLYHYEFSTDTDTVYECSFDGYQRINSAVVDTSYDCGEAQRVACNIIEASDKGQMWDLGQADSIYPKESAILLIFENYPMQIGDLKYRERTATPDPIYRDGIENVVSKWMTTPIKLV